MLSGSILIQSLGYGVIAAAPIAIGAMGFSLQISVTNILNVSYGNMLTVGAFAALIVENNHLGLAATSIVAPLAGAIFMFLLARTLFAFFARRRATAFELVMVSLAASLIIEFSIDAAAKGQSFSFTYPSGKTLHVGDLVFTTESLVLIGVAILLYLLILGALHLTRLGKALRAVATDPQLARACGVPMRRILNLTWLVSGGLAGLAGLLYVSNSLTVAANAGLNFLVLVLAAALLGGAGSATGAVVASLVVGIATEFVAAIGGQYYSQAIGLAILAVVLIVRQSARTSAGVARDEVTV